ncbi:MAG: hypothetical protein R3F65_32515 [bacterium]
MSKSTYKPRARVALSVAYDLWRGAASEIRRDLGIGRWDADARVWRMTAESAGRLALACRLGGAWAAAEAIEAQIHPEARPGARAVLGPIARRAHEITREARRLDPAASYAVTLGAAMRELWHRVRHAGLDGLGRWWVETGVTDDERAAARAAEAEAAAERKAARAAERQAALDACPGSAAGLRRRWEALADDRAAIEAHGSWSQRSLLAGITETIARRGHPSSRQLEVVEEMAEEAREAAAEAAEREADGISTHLMPCADAPEVGFTYTRDGFTHTVVGHGKKTRIDEDTASMHGDGFLGHEGGWAVEVRWQKRAVEAA